MSQGTGSQCSLPCPDQKKFCTATGNTVYLTERADSEQRVRPADAEKCKNVVSHFRLDPIPFLCGKKVRQGCVRPPPQRAVFDRQKSPPHTSSPFRKKAATSTSRTAHPVACTTAVANTDDIFPVRIVALKRVQSAAKLDISPSPFFLIFEHPLPVPVGGDASAKVRALSSVKIPPARSAPSAGCPTQKSSTETRNSLITFHNNKALLLENLCSKPVADRFQKRSVTLTLHARKYYYVKKASLSPFA